MELEFERDTIMEYEPVTVETLCQEETIESIVPDACPDILRMIEVCGQVMLRSRQAQEGAVVVSGEVHATVLYQPENADGLCHMDVSLPFTAQFNAPGLSEQGKVIACCRLRKADARILNPRKILVRVDLATEITACQPVERTYCTAVSNGECHNICQKQLHTEHYHTTDIQEKPFVLEESIRLKSNQGEVPQVLFGWVHPGYAESKLIGSKLVFKGNATVTLLLREAGGNLSTTTESIPFSQIVEVTGAGETNDCRVDVEINSFDYAVRPENPDTVSIQLELLAQIRIYTLRPATLLQDLYSTSCHTTCHTEEQHLCRSGECRTIPQSVRKLVETQGSVRSIVDSRLDLCQITQSQEGNEVVFRADAALAVLYLDDSDTVQCVHETIPVECRLEYDKCNRYFCHCDCPNDVYAAPTADGIEVRFNVEFQCLITTQFCVPTVTGAELGEPRYQENGTRPSIVLRLTAQGDSLWDIAKSYGTTTEQILAVNHLETDTLPLGTMLLIPGA